MSLNLSEEMMEDALKINVAIYSVAITLVLVPASALLAVNIIAILLSKRIHWKMRALMVYIVLPEVMSVLIQILIGIYPILYFQDFDLTGMCQVVAYIYSVTIDFRVVSTFLYSLCIYIGLKVGLSKINWKVFIVMLVAPLVCFFIYNQMLLYDESFISTEVGSCTTNGTSPILSARIAITAILDCFILTSLAVIFSVLSFCYVKRNAMKNDQIQKGMVKSLAFFILSSVIQLSSPVIIPLYIFIFSRTTFSVWGIQITRATCFTLYSVTSTIPSVVMIYFVKPLRDTLKICCTLGKKNSNDSDLVAVISSSLSS